MGVDQIRNSSLVNDIYKSPTIADETPNPNKGHTYMQWLFAIFANFCLVTYGLQAGWTSPMLKVLKSPGSPTGHPLTETELSWIASVLCLTAILGVPFYSYLADTFGRRKALLAIAAPQAMCWCLKLSSANTTVLMVSRILSGLAAGGCFIVIPIYVKELAQDSIRGALGSILILAQNFGMLVMFAIGAYLDYYTVLWIVVPLPFLTFLALLKAPESPSYLVKIGKIKEAASAVAFFRGLDPSDKAVQNEIKGLRSENDYYMSLPELSYRSIYKERPWRRAFILMTVVMTVHSYNGSFVLITFASSILESSGVTVDPELASMSCPAVMAISSVLSMSYIERLGRRLILATACLLVSFSMATIGVVILMQHQGANVVWWLPVMAMAGAMAGYGAGVGPVPYVIMSEIFNFQVRAKCMGLIVGYAWFLGFLQLFAFDPISKAFGPHMPFFSFAFVDLFGVFFVLFFLPETRGKTVEQVENELRISLGNFFVSYSIAWTSSALTVLTTDDSPIGKITEGQANLVGSIPMLATTIMALLGSWLADNIGRKKTLTLGGLCFILSWSLITTAPNVTYLLVGRFVSGLASGIQMVILVPFVSEISEISTRGTLMSLSMVLYSCGMLASYLLGWFVSYQVINYINLTLCTASVVLVSMLKETPAYLVEKEMEKEAIKSLQFYRGVTKQTEGIMIELRYLKNQKASNKIPNEAGVEKSSEPEKEKLRSGASVEEVEDVSAWIILWRSKAYKRALIASIMNLLFLIFGGTVAISAYATQLFTQASKTLSPEMCSVMLAISFALGGLIAMVITDLVGRRVLMMASGILCSGCLVILASLMHWAWGPSWAVPAALLGYCCICQAGLGNVPMVVMAETFPPKLKSLTSMIIMTLMGPANFLVLALFRPVVDALGFASAFLVFAAVCMLATIHTLYCMKETRGVPQEEIRRMYEEGYLYRKRK